MKKEELKATLKELLDEEKENENKEEDKNDSKDEKSVEVNVDKIFEEFSDKIVSAIEKSTEHKDDNTLTRLWKKEGGMQAVMFPSDLSELRKYSKEDKIVTWFKSLMMRKEDVQADRVFKALIEGTDAEGGYLVPEEFRSEVWRLLPDMAIMRKVATILPMSTDTLNLNTLEAEPAAYWTSEYASKSTTSAEFGRVTLSPNKLVCLLPVSQELIADANIDIVNFITQLFAEKIARTEDKAFFVGSGSGQPQGISSCSGILTYAVGGVLDFDDILNMIYKVPQSVRGDRSAAFVASAKVISILKKVKDSQSRYILTPGASSDISRPAPETLWGKAIYEQNDIPEDQIFFGAWRYYIIGDRQSLAVTTTTEGGDAWRRDSVEIKSKIRVDGKCVKAKAFVKGSGVQS